MIQELKCPICKNPALYKIEFEENKEYIIIVCQHCKKEFKYIKNYKKVYIARSFLVSDSKYKYALDVKTSYSGILEIIDPLLYEEDIENYKNLVQTDINLIASSDILVAFIMQLSIGTISKIVYAYKCGIPVYIINPTRTFLQDPWLKYHSEKIYENMKDCYKDIINACIEDINRILVI